MHPTGTVSSLLHDLRRDGAPPLDVVSDAAAVSLDRLEAAIDAEVELSLVEQLRLLEAVLLHAPLHHDSARRLRNDLLASGTFAAATKTMPDRIRRQDSAPPRLRESPPPA